MDQLELDLQAIIDQTPAPAGNENKISAPFRLLLPLLQKVLLENKELVVRVVALEKELTEARCLQTTQATASNDGAAELIANVEQVRSELETIKADFLLVKKVPSILAKRNNVSNKIGEAGEKQSPSQPSQPIVSNQVHAESTDVSTTWSTVVKRSVRGSLREVSEETSAPKKKMLEMASLKHEPYMDFKVQGLPRQETTNHGSIAEYNDYVKAVLVENGFKVRFVTVFKVQEGSKRGTTIARVGSFVSERSSLMDPGNWPPNCFVQPWQYNKPHLSDVPQQQSTGPKNRNQW